MLKQAVWDEDEPAGQERKPMLRKTRKALDEFYLDYNKRLAGMLADKRWLWDPKDRKAAAGKEEDGEVQQQRQSGEQQQQPDSQKREVPFTASD